MPLLLLPSRMLAGLGRWSAQAVALSVFVGLALPPLAALGKPLIVPCILALLTLAFLRTDLSGALAPRQAGVALAAIAWSMVALPVALGSVTSSLGEPTGVTLALLMQACAPPIMSAPAFALLLGLDPRLSMVVMVGGMALTPLSAPLLVAHFTHGALAIDPLGLALRLGAVVGGTAIVGLGLRRLVSPGRLVTLRAQFDGANVLLLGLLAVGLMDGVSAWFLKDPAFVGGLAALAFALSLGGLAATMLLFRRAGGGAALMLGFIGGHRNISVMVAAAGAVLPPETWLYVAVAQFPIYLLPVVLLPLARRIRRNETHGS